MNPIIALQNHTLVKDIALGTSFGAVSGGLIGGSADNTMLGILFGACLFAFAMRPRNGRRKSGG